MTEHRYAVSVRWTGDLGTGTSDYHAYGREHDVLAGGRPTIPGSSDPAFRGDPSRWNPEQLLVVSLSQCHLLTFLHLAAVAGVVVVGYSGEAEGVMVMDAGSSGGGKFESVTLRPSVLVADASMLERAQALHADVPALCFIARSVRFPVYHEPSTNVAVR